MKRPYVLLGVLAPIAYALAVIIGGATTPGYSHVANAISELFSAGRHPHIIVLLLFATYNLGLLAFGAWAFLDRKAGYGKLFRAAMALLAVIGLLGAATLFFPQDERGTTATFAGTMHIVLSAISSLLTMVAMLLAGLDYFRNKDKKLFAYYSFASLAIVLISGGISAASVASNSPYLGLFERVTIGAFLLWVLLLSACMARPER